MIVTTHGLGDCISGMILYNETISQRNKDGTYFLEVIADAGVIPGIKVDTGAKDMDCYPGEKIFQGLDGLRDPAAVPGIAFLSGGQSADLASARLNAMNVRFKSRSPWELAFSFAERSSNLRWSSGHGEEAHILAAQQALYHRAKCNQAARCGQYDEAIERKYAENKYLATQRS